MMTAKKKKQPKLKQDWDEKPKPKKPEISQNILNEFLKDKINLPEGTKVKEIKCNHLYYNRYRLNVWVEKYEEGSFYPEVWIEYSYFLHLHDNTIVDMTIPMKPKKDKFF